MDDEVVEVGLEPDRGPLLLDGPAARAAPDGEAAQTLALAGAHQQVAVRGLGGLHDGVAGPGVLPEHRAVRRVDGEGSRPALQYDLRDAGDGEPLGGAVAGPAVGSGPAQLAGLVVVAGQVAGRGDDDHVAHHQRGAGEAPDRQRGAGVGGRVARPDGRAVARVEGVDDAGGAQGVDAAVGEGRRRPRTRAGVGLPEAGGVAVLPHELAGGRVVAGDDLLLAPLLLGVQKVALDGEGRPARSDRPTPHLDRWRLPPVGLEPHPGYDAVSTGPAETGPLGLRLQDRRGRRERRRLALRARQEGLLRSRRPAPRELGPGAVDPLGAHEGPDATGDEDRPDQGQPARPGGESPRGRRPGHQGEAEDRNHVHVEDEPHAAGGDGLVEQRPGGDHARDHEEEGAPALDPGSPAEERPPYDDDQPPGQGGHGGDHPRDVGGDHDGKAQPDQPLSGHGRHAGPQAEGG